MVINSYAFLDSKLTKKQRLELFVQDRAKYVLCETDPAWEPHFSHDSTVFVNGVLRGCGKVCRRAIEKNAKWFYMDNGYGCHWQRITFKSTAPSRLLDRPNDRTPTELKNLQPWRGNRRKSKENILILPPSLPYIETFQEDQWLNNIIHSLKEYTDRNLVVRPKPAENRDGPCWKKQLSNAYCLVSFGSNLGIDAMVQGIPVISFKYCSSYFASFTLEDLETERLNQEPDRQKIINNCMYHSFSKDEFESGYAWDISMENAYEV